MATDTTKTEACIPCTPAESNAATSPDITAVPAHPILAPQPTAPSTVAAACFPVASSCATVDAQGFVGTANVVTGLVTLLGADGAHKTLHSGDAVKPGDIVQTGKDGSVAIEFTDGNHLFMGRESMAKIDDSVVNACEVGEQNTSNGDAIQQAILAGADPTQLCEAPAAGGGDPGAVGDETQNMVNVRRTGALGNVYAGYDTTGLAFQYKEAPEYPVYPEPEPEPEPPPHECPVVYVQLLHDDSNAEGWLLCHVVRLVDANGNPLVVQPGHEITITLNYAGYSSGPDTSPADPSDYIAQYTVVIHEGESSARIVIQSIDDHIVELTEQYQITIAGIVDSGGCDTIYIDQSNDNVIGTIYDNDPACPIVYAKLVHDDSNAEGWLICHQVQLVDADGNPFVVPEGHEVTVVLNYAGHSDSDTNPASPEDYVAPSWVVITAGNSTANIVVQAIDDNIVETTEQYQVTIAGVYGSSGCGEINIHPTDNSVIGTIFDNDCYPTISVDDVTVNEDAGVAVFTITLSSPTGQTITVDYDTAGNTATEGVDFTDTHGTLTFAPGVTSLTVSVPVADDYLHEVSENFFLNLSNPTNATFGDDQGVGTLLDEANPGSEDTIFVKLVHDDSNTEGWNICHQVQLVDANGNPVTVPNGHSITVTLNYAGQGDNPAESADYVAQSTVVIAAGSSSANVVVPTVDDSLFEGTEQYQATIGAIVDSGAFEAVAPHATESVVIGTIWDNDNRTDAVDDTAIAVEEGHEWRPAGYQDHVTDLPAEGSQATGNVLGNDTGSVMSVTAVDATSVAASGETLISGLYGNLFIQANGDFRYEVANGNTAVDALNRGDNLQESFTYTLQDASGTSDNARLDLTIQGTDDAPVIESVSVYSPQISVDTGLASGDVLGDDMLTDGDRGRTYDPDNAPGDLNLDFQGSSANLGITYMGGYAGYQNIVGLYQIGPDGTPCNPQLIFVDRTAAVDGDAPDQFLGVFQGLSGQVGFFLIPNANSGGVHSDITTADLAFQMGSDGYPNITIAGTAYDNVLFSHQQFNDDGKEHVISGFEAQDDGSVVIAFEDINLNGDLNAGGWYGANEADRDYDDFVLKFDLCHTQGENGEIIQDIALSDVDDTNLERAYITLTNAKPGDLLAVADAQGLTVTIDASNPDIIKVTLEGSAPQSLYEEVIESITLDTVDTDNSLRLFEVQVDDGDKLSNIISFNVAPGCRPDADVVPTIGPDAATLDEDALLGAPALRIFSGDLHVNFGGDGPGSVVFLGNQNGLDTGLTSHGAPVVLNVASDSLVNGMADGRTVFTATLNPDHTYSLELKDVVDHPENPDEDTLSSLQLYVRAQDADDDTALGVINVVIGDDVPEIGAPTSASVQTETLGITTNLVIAFDISGSMSEQAGVDVDGDGDRDGHDTKLLLAQNAVKELIDSYQAMGGVNILFVPFSSDANATQSVWHDADSAKAMAESFRAGGYTNYQDALQETMDHVGTDQPAADQNVYYFVSDGNPTMGDMNGADGQSGLLPTWQSWAPNHFDHVFAIGIGNSVDVDGNARGSLEQIAGVGADPHPVIPVVDLAQLAEVLVGTASQTGVELTVSGDNTIEHHFGADGPADGAGPKDDGGALPFSWDGTHVTASGSDTNGLAWTVTSDGLGLIGSRDGTPLIKVYIDDPQFGSGESGYKVIQFGSLEGISSLTIPYTIVDGDGDHVRSQLTLTLSATAPVPPPPPALVENSHSISNIVLYLAAVADHDVIMKVKLEGFPDDVFSVEVKEFVDQHYPDQDLVAYTIKAGDNASGMGPGEGDLVILDQATDQSDLPTSRVADADTYQYDEVSQTVELNPTGDGNDQIILGAPASNDLHGGGGTDLIAGGAGNDQIDGQEGGDQLHGGAGNDTVAVGEGDTAQGEAGDDTFVLDDDLKALNDFIKVDGGEGHDTLDIGSFFEDTIDLSILADRVDNVEVLKLGAQDNVSLSLQDVVDMTDTHHTLFITGDSSNELSIDKNEWTDRGTASINNADYHAYSGDNGTMLYVDVSINTVMVEDPNNGNTV